MTLTPTRKLAAAVVLFALGVVLVGVASAVHRVWPLFVAWIPLLTVPYVLTRPDSGEIVSVPARAADDSVQEEAGEGGQPPPEP